MQIVIPSMGRPKAVSTIALVPSALVCVPKSQAKAYAGVGQVVTHPDQVLGLAAKRNWILDRFQKEDAVLMLDDDLAYLQRLHLESGAGRAQLTDPSLILLLIIQIIRLARECGCYLFGWQAATHPEYFSGHKPFALTGYVNGCGVGFIRGHGLRYDPRIIGKEDYDISAANAYRHHKCFRDLRFAWAQQQTFRAAGGLSLYRNSATEERDLVLLRERYGEAIQVMADKGSGQRKAAYAGARKIELKLPF